jgi:hypothetical protein
MNLAGQVQLNTPFGNALYFLAKNTPYLTFLEVGTWKGFGTTLCITEGLVQRIQKSGSQNIHFYTVESNKQFFEEASTNWNKAGLPFLHLCYGRLHESGLLSKQEVVTHPYFGHVKTHFDLWYEQDVIDYKESPYINPVYLPQTIDVLVLDGGEFSGYADWLALKEKKPQIVCLDDTTVMKNERVYKELLTSEEWEIHAKDENDRHGWAIFCRKKPSP